MAGGTSYTDELQRAIRFRTGEIERIASDLRGSIPPARKSLHKAFALLDPFGTGVADLVETEVDRAPDEAALAPILETLLRHLTLVADFVEKHLAHGGRHELSQALSDEVSEELEALGLAHYNVVLSHGGAANFETLYGDIDGHINGPVGSSTPTSPITDRFFALFSIPRVEGSGIYWKPILIGHEVAHVHVSEQAAVDDFDLASKFDFARAGTIVNPRSPDALTPHAPGLYRIAQDWTKELLCDAHALHRYGPAAVAGLGEYFATIGALDGLGVSHPPGWLRIHLMLKWLGTLTDERSQRVIQPWVDRGATAPTYSEPWAGLLADMFVAHCPDILSVAETCPAPRYDHSARTEPVNFLADRLALGIAGAESVQSERTTKADVVNAAWVARSEEADTAIDRLARKAIESITFVDRWIEAGGSLPTLASATDDDSAISGDDGSSALSAEALARRLRAGHVGKGIVATPLLQLPKGSALDLRLGSRFIVFRRTGGGSFDPLDKDTDPRSIQIARELSWTEQIVLHPQELLLAATLEYLVIPDDLTAQVITRSSYGRLGLLSATAVQIHPNFHGCLTLELVNLSNLPLVLTPGERVAQLVAWSTDPVPPSDQKYHCPIGPEFSKARIDIESEILRSIRNG